MNLLAGLIEFVRRNPLLTLAVVLLAIFAPSVLGGIFRVLLWVVLGFVVLAVVATLSLRQRLQKMQAAQQPPRKEGEVHVEQPAERVQAHRKVGDYVPFEDIEDEK